MTFNLRKYLAVLVAGVATVMTLVARSPAQPTPGAESEAPPTAAASSGPTADDRAGKRLEICRKRLLETIDEAAGSRDPQLPRDRGPRDLPASEHLDVLVLTVPDPNESNYRYYFDSVIEGLDGGVENNGLFRDRVWMPWSDTRELPGIEPKETYASCAALVPGVRMFRRQASNDPAQQGSEHPYLAVLVVGETPTSGVRKRALSEALRIASDDGASGDKAKIKILGPTFSGSAASLGEVFEDFARTEKNAKATYEVVSGGASGHLIKAGLSRSRSGKENDPVTFKMTTVPARDIECTYLRYLYRLKHEEAPELVDDARSPFKMLESVAVLREMGTEFGGDLRSKNSEGNDSKSEPSKTRCPYHPEVDLRFPIGISALRDVYFDSPDRPDSIARRTYVDLDMREERGGADRSASQSTRTTTAHDLVLSNLLGEISKVRVQNVAIQATDVADAAFLARKIRDVAPDVRIAFFASDVLLIHPSLREILKGSYVVTPYPFFGADDFSTSLASSSQEKSRNTSHQHFPFMNTLQEGTYNAVQELLRKPEAPLDRFVEYNVFESPRDPHAPPLPIWIAAIGNGMLVPVAARASDDCEHLVVGHAFDCKDGTGAGFDCVCHKKTPQEAERFRFASQRSRMPGSRLRVDPDVTPPNIWQFVLAALLLGALVDWRLERRVVAPRPDPIRPESLASGADVDLRLDHGLACVQYALYRGLRRLIFLVGIGYMFFVQAMAISAYEPPDPGNPVPRLFPRVMLVAAALGFVVELVLYVRAGYAFVGGYRELRRLERNEVTRALSIKEEAEQAPRGLWGRGLRSVETLVGFNPPKERYAALTQSLNHFRALVVLSAIIALGLVLLVVLDLIQTGVEPGHLFHVVDQPPSVSIFVLRTLPLVNGVSPAAPLLLVALSSYAWVWGRMARLRLAMGLSHSCPAFAAGSAVAMPLSAIVDSTPAANGRRALGNDTGLAQIERALANATWRPLSGPFALFGTLALLSMPVLLFVLKPPSTVESQYGTILLYAALGLSSILVAATLIQLVQYWFFFRRLLRRLLVSPVAKMLGEVDPILRESVERQVAARSDDVLRAAVCVDRLRRLVERDDARMSAKVWGARVDGLKTKLAPLMRGPGGEAYAWAGADAGAVGSGLVDAAAEILEIVAGSDSPGKKADGESSSEAQAWDGEARTFVATVVAMLLNRHVRQFRYFLWGLMGSSLGMLLAIDAYVFQPRRVLLSTIWLITVSVAVSGLYIYVDLERSTALSRIGATKEGEVEVDTGVITRFLKWGALPLLGVAAVQYPAVANAVFGWFEPLSKIFK